MHVRIGLPGESLLFKPTKTITLPGFHKTSYTVNINPINCTISLALFASFSLHIVQVRNMAGGRVGDDHRSQYWEKNH